MVDREAIRQVAERLEAAVDFPSIFGILPDADIKAQCVALHKRFSALAFVVHPDRTSKENEDLANSTFQKLHGFWKDAESALKSGKYSDPFTGGLYPSEWKKASSTELRSVNGIYRLAHDPFRTGDFSFLYRGQLLGSVNQNVILKIASDPTTNSWLEREAKVLALFRDAKNGNGLFAIKKTVPELLDTFFVTGERGTRYRVNVFRQKPDLVSVSDILKVYPNGVDPIDGGWIVRRVFAQTLAASMAKVVHGSILPDHILVDPIKREPVHIGWAHSIDHPKYGGGRITHVIDRFKDYYPPEVFERKPQGHRTDIYMAAKTVIALLGGDVVRNTLPKIIPISIQQILLRCVEKSPTKRPDNGKALIEEFTREMRAKWGKQYRPLVMPA